MDEVIYYKDRIYLVLGSNLRDNIFHVAHDSPITSHQGFFKTYWNIRKNFSWRGLKEEILRHVYECDVC